MSKTRLTQARVSNLSDAHLKLSQASENEIPIVVVPDDRFLCSCSISVPQGPSCIEHRYGRDVKPDRLAEPGFHCIPSHTRIAYCVTAQACTYKAPVKACPTKDNVMVDCDLTLVFEIGPTPEDVKLFVYNLGAARFDEFLSAAVEESIRHLIRTHKHHEIYELRGSSSHHTLKELNHKFQFFGVKFRSAAITDVSFADELQRTLQETTEFQSKLKKQKKKQKHAMDKIRFDADKVMEQKVKEHERKLQEMRAARTRSLIDREKLITEVASQAAVKMLKEQQAVDVGVTRGSANVKVSQAEGAKLAEEIVSNAQIKYNRTKIAVDQEAKTKIYEAQQALEAEKKRMEALVELAKAEAAAAKGLMAKRQHDLDMAKAEVLQALAQSSQISISGDQGDKLIEQMIAEVSMLKAK